MEAAMKDFEIVQILGKDKDVKLELKDKEGRTAFMHAANNRQLESLKFLKKRKAKIKHIINVQKNQLRCIWSRQDSCIFFFFFFPGSTTFLF